MTPEDGGTLLEKAGECLAGAEAEFLAGRFNNCANRCYYACFQAAIVALARAGIRPAGTKALWGHSFVPAQFDGELINRRKLFAPSLRGNLGRAYTLRQQADYDEKTVTAVQASRALANCRAFVGAIMGRS